MESAISSLSPVSGINPGPILPSRNQKQLAWQDILNGFIQWQAWVLLAYQDIKIRYRRSILGPFWITLSMAITVYTMGFLYGHLFHSDLASYFPYLAAGMLGWALISNAIVELTETFTQYEGILKQIKLPYTLYVHRIAMRNLFMFLHNLLVMIPILIFFHHTAKVNAAMLMLIPALIVFYINALSYGLVFAMLGARYRDISQIIKSLIQIIFFLTPIMWKPDVLPPHKKILVALNPFHSFLEMIRAPLIGVWPSLYDIGMVLAVTAFGIWVSWTLFSRYRARIIYWI